MRLKGVYQLVGFCLAVPSFMISNIFAADASAQNEEPGFAIQLATESQTRWGKVLRFSAKKPVAQVEENEVTKLFAHFTIEVRDVNWGLTSLSSAAPVAEGPAGSYLTAGLPDVQIIQVANQLGQFSVRARIKALETRVELQAVHISGETQPVRLLMGYPGWSGFAEKHFRPKTPEPAPEPQISITSHSLSPSLAYSSLTYRQTDVDEFRQTALTAKLSYLYRAGAKVSLGLNTFFSAVPFSSTLAGVSARYIGANARVGYEIMARDDWSLSMMTGAYFTTMIVTDSQFGFRDLMGPQLFPVLARKLGDRTVSAYFKFSPVGSSFWIRDISSREIAGGVRYGFSALGKTAAVTVDYAQLLLNLEDGQAENDSLSIGIEMGF